MKAKIPARILTALLTMAGCGAAIAADQPAVAPASAPTSAESATPSAATDAPPPRPISLSRKNPVEIQWKVGLQDQWVPDVDSHTYGVHISGALNATLPTSGAHLLFEADAFLDYDQDHLDPQHTPFWLQMHMGFDGPIVQSAKPDVWYISWVGDVNTRANTVSGIEREIRIIPGIAVGGKLGVLSIEGRIGGGYYYLQIDDDVATKRGYTRDDLTNQAWVLTPTLSASLALTPHFKLIGRAQEWHDGSVWLETKYYAALEWDLSRFIPHGVLEFSIESTQYNLSGTVYHPANPATPYQPILPWDDDRLLMLSIKKWW